MKTRRVKFLSMTAIVIAAVAALAPDFTPRPTDTLLGRATRLGPIPSYAASFCHFLDDRTVLTAMRNNIHAVVMFDSETGRGVPGEWRPAPLLRSLYTRYVADTNRTRHFPFNAGPVFLGRRAS